MPDAVYQANWIDGVYIRLVWATIEPKSGAFDFRTLDQEMDRAVKTHKRVSLSIIAGGRAPNWLNSAGIKTYSLSVGRGGGSNRRCIPFTFGVPWDSAYQNAFIAVQKAVADHLKATPGAWDALRIVKLTGMNQITEELRVPIALDSRFDDCNNTSKTPAAIGYSPAAAEAAWVTIARGIATAFPGKVLALDVLERNDFPPAIGAEDPKQAIIADGLRLAPGRFAVQWNGLNLGGPTAPSVLQAARDGAVIGWQTNAFRGLSGSGCNAQRQAAAQPCDAQHYKALLQRGVVQGASYIEIWAPDALAFPHVVEDIEHELDPGRSTRR